MDPRGAHRRVYRNAPVAGNGKGRPRRPRFLFAVDAAFKLTHRGGLVSWADNPWSRGQTGAHNPRPRVQIPPPQSHFQVPADKRLTIGRTSRGASAPRLRVQTQPLLSAAVAVS